MVKFKEFLVGSLSDFAGNITQELKGLHSIVRLATMESMPKDRRANRRCHMLLGAKNIVRRKIFIGCSPVPRNESKAPPANYEQFVSNFDEPNI